MLDDDDDGGPPTEPHPTPSEAERRREGWLQKGRLTHKPDGPNDKHGLFCNYSYKEEDGRTRINRRTDAYKQ